MAIKDQCEQCKKYNSTCIENIEFNGQSCDQYKFGEKNKSSHT